MVQQKAAIARLEAAIARLEAGWQAGSPPDLNELVEQYPDVPRDQLLIELAHIDLEYRLKRGDPIRVEQYLTLHPELAQSEKVVESLLKAEFLYRRRAVLKEIGKDSGSGIGPKLDQLPEVPGYELLGVLGSGAMGVVYKARQTSVDRTVAVKTLPADRSVGDEALRRFVGEARAAADIEHPAIVKIFEVQSGDGLPFFSMEYLPGGTLAERLTVAGLPKVNRAADLVASLADAVEAAHAARILHRDLKPSNILFTAPTNPDATDSWADGATAKIADFGLARRGNPGLTAAGEILGTPSYMAPEQARGENSAVSAATDVWALGVILYECLTGERPFRGESVQAVLDQLRTADPTPPRTCRPEIPRDLDSICLKCLRKDPAQRYGTAAELAADLRRYLAHRPTVARPIGFTERAAKWRRRNPVTSTLLAAAAMTLLAAAGYTLWLWDTHWRVHHAYFADVVRRHGVRTGYRELTQAERSARALVYKVSRQGGRVVEVAALTGRGRPTSHGITDELRRTNSERTEYESEQVYQYRYVYDAAGRLVDEVAIGRLGQELHRLHFTSPTTAQYTIPDGVAEAAHQHEAGDPRSTEHLDYTAVPGLPKSRTRSGVVYLRYEWTPEGFPATEMYLDADGRPRASDDGIFGKRWEYMTDGRNLSVTYLGEDGRPKDSAMDRLATIRYERNQYGAATRLSYFDATGRPCRNPYGTSARIQTFDAVGNMIESRQFGPDGQPVTDSHGDAGIHQEYSPRGEVTRYDYIGHDGRPCQTTFGYSSIVKQYDDRGRLVAEDYLGPDGRPGRTNSYYAGYRQRFDDRDNVVEIGYIGADGRACRNAEWVARQVRTFDGSGRILTIRYFGPDGRRCWNSEGVSGRDNVYNAAGQLAREVIVGLDDRPAACQLGYAIREFRYDSRGNTTGISYYDADGRPCSYKEAHHRLESTFNERGFETGWAYFDVEGRPTRGVAGVSSVQRLYDSAGLVQEEHYFGPDGKPCANVNGIAGTLSKYDSVGRLTERRYLGVDGAIGRRRGGECGFRQEHDEIGRLRKVQYIGPTGKSAPDRRGVTSERYTLDRLGNQVRTEFLDPAGQLVGDHDGVAEIRRRYDSYRNVVEISYFGPSGDAASDRDGTHVIRYEYDARDNETVQEYFGPDRRPMASSGNARVFMTFDDRDLLLSEVGYDVDGKAVIDRTGCFRIRSTFDDRGNEVAVRYYDVDERAMQSAYGYAGYDIRWDDHWKAVERTYRDLDGRPMATEVVVERVDIPGVGHTAGLRVGDVVESYDGRPVRLGFLLVRELEAPQAHRPSVPLVVRRGGVQQTLRVPTGTFEAEFVDAVPGRYRPTD